MDGFGKNKERTDPSHGDARLRGRTYAISFDRVWSAAVEICQRERRGWSLVWMDDRAGEMEYRVQSRVFKWVDDVKLTIVLDVNAQTRVDMSSASRQGKSDFGVNRRRIVKFFSELDKTLEATPKDILDAAPSKPTVES